MKEQWRGYKQSELLSKIAEDTLCFHRVGEKQRRRERKKRKEDNI